MRAIRRRYDAQYFDTVADRIPLYRDIITRRYARLVRQVAGSGRLLELGCGDGRLLAELASNFDVTGIDISVEAIARARHRVPDAHLVVGDIAVCDPQTCFDVVVAFNVLEHLPDPPAVMSRVHDMLTDGGQFIFAVPNRYGVVGSALVRFMNWMDRTHISTYTRERWLELAQQLGFEQTQVLNATWFGPTRSDLARAVAPILIVVLYRRAPTPPPRDDSPASETDIALALAAHPGLLSGEYG